MTRSQGNSGYKSVAVTEGRCREQLADSQGQVGRRLNLGARVS
ncbi:hypothetical protein V6Z12_A10G238800 [Gossypium hirsutum]|uniref:Uncharacterized protein n=1 Tax=Gossypium tomentosum TaxID=34277 RepID=A0A5D2NXF8_GOSTO|nr:hypothetical protein ES332_A10G248000v1 [Gossypium tomentosum]